MNTAHFKKIDDISQTHSSNPTLNGGTENSDNSVIKPPFSLFHNLPEISGSSQSRSTELELSTDQLNGNSYEDGVRDGEAKATQIYADTIKLMEATLETLRAQYGSIKSEIEASHLAAVAHCLKALLPEMATRSAKTEISEFVRSLAAKSIAGEIILQVHPSDAQKVQELCGSQNPDKRAFNIVGDETKVPNTLTAKWSGGGAKIDLAATVNECLSVLDRALDELTNV